MDFVTTYLGLTPYCLSSNHGYFLKKIFFFLSPLSSPSVISFSEFPSPFTSLHPADCELCEVRAIMWVSFCINLFSESASETEQGPSRPAVRVCLLSDCPLTSLTGDSSPLLAELTIVIKMGTFPGYFPRLGLLPDSGRSREKLAIVSSHRERFLYS